MKHLKQKNDNLLGKIIGKHLIIMLCYSSLFMVNNEFWLLTGIGLIIHIITVIVLMFDAFIEKNNNIGLIYLLTLILIVTIGLSVCTSGFGALSG